MQLQERVLAAVLCSAVGDAIGYRNGQWEFCYSGVKIHQQLAKQFHSVNGVWVGGCPGRACMHVGWQMGEWALWQPHWSKMGSLVAYPPSQAFGQPALHQTF